MHAPHPGPRGFPQKARGPGSSPGRGRPQNRVRRADGPESSRRRRTSVASVARTNGASMATPSRRAGAMSPARGPWREDVRGRDKARRSIVARAIPRAGAGPAWGGGAHAYHLKEFLHSVRAFRSLSRPSSSMSNSNSSKSIALRYCRLIAAISEWCFAQRSSRFRRNK